jgi:hypothetical protein
MTVADQVGFRVPDGFVELPYLDDPALLAEKLSEVVEVVTVEATEEEREGLLALYRTAYGALLREGAVYVGNGYFRTDDGDVTMASLNAFVKDHTEANPYLIVSQTLRSHAEGGPAHAPGMTATAMQLPCGPAVFVLRMTLTPDDLAAAAPIAWQAQAVVPFPQGKKVLVIDLSTPCPTEAGYYAGILDGIAHTVTFSTSESDQGTGGAPAAPAAAQSASRIAGALG